ncbi:MAG: DUF484 family protein [Pseudomonadota bacterium]
MSLPLDKAPPQDLRDQILADPSLVLEDPAVMAALLSADGVEGRNIIDLRGKVVERLEDRLDKLEDANRTVIAAAYENLAGTNQVQRAVLTLLAAESFRAFVTALGDDVPGTLAVDAIRLGLETTSATPGTSLGPDGPHHDLIIALPRHGVSAYLGAEPDQPARRVTLRKATGVSDDLYGSGDPWIQSEAVLRLDLGPGLRPGLLALGSEDPQRFSPDQASDLLTFFAGALEKLLRRWLG